MTFLAALLTPGESWQSLYVSLSKVIANLVKSLHFDFLAAFTETNITDEIISDAGICQMCFVKFDEYDELQTRADQVQIDLVSLFETSNATLAEKTAIKTEQESVYQDDIVFEMVEEDVKENDEQLLMVETEDQDFQNDQMIVSYDWLNEADMPVDVIQVKTVKKPQPVLQRQNRNDENFIVVQHGPNQKSYQCDICQRLFKERSKLRAHRDIHTTERNVICPVSSYLLLTVCQMFTFSIHRPVEKPLKHKPVFDLTNESTIRPTTTATGAVRVTHKSPRSPNTSDLYI